MVSKCVFFIVLILVVVIVLDVLFGWGPRCLGRARACGFLRSHFGVCGREMCFFVLMCVVAIWSLWLKFVLGRPRHVWTTVPKHEPV